MMASEELDNYVLADLLTMLNAAIAEGEMK